MKNTAQDQNGKSLSRSVRSEIVGGQHCWGVTVWFGRRPATTIRRYYYDSRGAARDGDISDEIGKRGRVA